MDDNFINIIVETVKKNSGLAISLDKRYLIEARLAELLENNAIESLADLALRIVDDSCLSKEVAEALATHESYFFRDNLPFDFVKAYFQEKLLTSDLGRPCEKVKLVSVASASGQEPYSLAMTIAASGTAKTIPFTIYASDFSEKAVSRIESGIYSEFELSRGIDEETKNEYFEECDEGYRIRDELREHISISRLNLLRDIASIESEVDFLFCRNVLIYFSPTDSSRIAVELTKKIRSGGFLVLGGGEKLPEEIKRLYAPATSCCPYSYRKY